MSHEDISLDDRCDDYSPICERCKCCGMDWVDCDSCGGEGIDGHDCGEDCCVCLDPEENIVCDICEGEGGWYACTCDENGKHKPWPKGTPVGKGA